MYPVTLPRGEGAFFSDTAYSYHCELPPIRYNSQVMVVNYTNDPIFLIYSLSSIRWYILFSYFKTFKIWLHEVSPLQGALIHKIHIYKPKMGLSSLLT